MAIPDGQVEHPPADHPQVELTGAPVVRRRLADEIAEKLTYSIATGSVAPESMLPNERTLAAHFGVSKGVIREAIKVVATRGLVSVQQGVGTTVNPRSQWNLHDPGVMAAMRQHLSLGQLLEVRKLLEPEITALAAQRRTDADLEQLRELLDDRPLVGDPEEALWSLTYHEAIAAAAHNPVYSILMSTLRILMRTKMQRDRPAGQAIEYPVGEFTADHRAIYEAIRAGDPVGARELAARHLEELTPFWEWLATQRGWSFEGDVG
jgi:GntR family transcriptional repressor for pyruvate dehydrogenase complex